MSPASGRAGATSAGDPAAVGDPAVSGPGATEGVCEARMAPVPTRVELRPTQHAPGAAGHMELIAPDSPYGVTVSADGRQRYEVTVQARTLPRPRAASYVAWATTPELDQVRRLGALDEDMRARGRVEWNKFLVLVTAESSPDGERWTGPIFLTGMSPSGLLHTMRGHGIFEAHGVGC